MDISDAAGESLRLSHHYREISDVELKILVRQKSELTEIAQQALAEEVSRRRLNLTEKVEPEDEPPRVLDPEYDEDRQLIIIATVWSLSDALQLQWLLDRAGIPFYMGEEHARGVDTVTSKFDQGVSVQVMRAAFPWVRDVMNAYAPKDAPADETEEFDGSAIRCPKCRSDDVVFERLIRDPERAEGPLKYKWTCDACGHQWTDDGIAKAG